MTKIIEIDGVELEFAIADGVLSVSRDGQPRGMIRVSEPNPPAPVDVVDPENVAPAEPNLPSGWYYDGTILMRDGSPDADGQLSGGTPVHSPSTPEES